MMHRNVYLHRMCSFNLIVTVFFSSIADLKDPRERMVQVVKWYLSAYHAGRKSSVAKKPYNPILGEVFKCHWDLAEDRNGPAEDTVVDGPVPWCKRNQLTFVAEQVSHHPPSKHNFVLTMIYCLIIKFLLVSAFYAEHVNKRISFNAHVYTKSKFLGLSICVYNIGQGIVSVSIYVLFIYLCVYYMILNYFIF